MIQDLICYHPVSIQFRDRLAGKQTVSDDLMCSAIARCAKKNKTVIIDCRRHPCVGGNYFVGGQDLPMKTIEEVYINKESVFKKSADVRNFLKTVGRHPQPTRYIIFESGISKSADIVLLIVSVKNAGRFLGLNAQLGNLDVDLIPATSTCSALFRPLMRPDTLHLNLIDYFERDYQCKGFFGDGELLLSMTYELYRQLDCVFLDSAHGAKKISGIETFKIDPL